MKWLILPIFILGHSAILPGQCVNFILNTQQSVDNFPSNCTNVTGSIYIGIGDITNLNGLSNVKTIGGSLSIYSNKIVNLSGLDKLTHVGGDVQIYGSDKLTSLHGLEKLATVGGSMGISYNPLLTNLEGLGKLTTVNGGLTITDNGISDLIGLGSLTSVGYFSIGYNSELISLNGLESLVNIEGSFSITENPKLGSLQSLNNLVSVGASFSITENEVLPCLEGLESLNIVGGNLNITDNPELISLLGVGDIDSLGGNITIQNNYHLSLCNNLNFCNLISQAGAVTIQNNDPGCNNLIEIDSACNSSSSDNCHLNITLWTQNQIDKFNFIYGCTNLEGNLNLSLNSSANDLNGLAGLTSIQGNLTVSGGSISDLEGLGNLESIGGNLTITNSGSIIAPIGLENITLLGGDVTFTSLYSLENFEGLNGLTNIGGNLWITGLPALQNFEGLNSLSSIGVNLMLTNNGASFEFQGLESLTSINGDFYVQENSNLNNFTGLDVLNTINGLLYIKDNPKLQNFSGFSGLQNIGGDFHVEDNAQLKNFYGLSSLETVGNRFRIIDNDQLINFFGLSNLASVTKSIHIQKNDALINLLGLNHLKAVGEDLRIGDQSISVGNPGLKNLSGLEGLDSIGGSLIISANYGLTTLEGLDNLQSINNDIYIRFNSALSQCNTWPVCDYLQNPSGNITIYSNANGCNSSSQILNWCSNTFSKVKGLVFADLNCDSIFNNNDSVLPHHLLRNADNDLPFITTNINGAFVGLIPPTATFSWKSEPVAGYSVFPGFQSISTDNFPQEFEGMDFGYCPDSFFHNLSVGISAYSPPRPGFYQQYQICVKNFGVFTEDFNLSFDISGGPGGSFVSIIDSEGGMINGNIVEWTFSGLEPFAPLCLKLRVYLSPSTPLGTVLLPHVSVFPSTGEDINLADNDMVLEEIVVGSFDPNDKSVEPNIPDMINYTLMNDTLFYTIRFQNTGTYPATFVELIDTLDQNLDLTSFRMEAASHNYVLSFPKPNIAQWFFDNINLPDSTSNEAESHGFVSFSIIPQLPLSENTEILNDVSIYFDYNTPIETNTTSNLLVFKYPILIESHNPQCYGSNDGMIFVSAISPEDVWYAWESGENSPILTGLGQGEYSLLVFNSEGQIVGNTSVVLIAPPPLELNVTSVPENDYNNDGSASVEVIGGTPPYNFLWSTNPPQNDSIAIGLAAGAYTVTVTDYQNCTQIANVEVGQLVSITEVLGDQVFYLFPNPTNGSVEVKINTSIDDGWAIKIHNTSGQLLKEHMNPGIRANADILIIDDLSSGVYYVSLWIENMPVARKKLVIISF